MTAYDIGPAFVQIFSHSDFGPHVANLPTLSYSVVNDEFDVHSGSPIDSTTMITALVDKLAPFYQSGSHYIFDNFRIFTKDPDPAVPVLVKAGAFTAKQGTNAAPGWTKAVQRTLSALDADGHPCRLVLLDAASSDSFDQETTIVPASALDDLFSEWSADSNGWASRFGSRPATFLELTTTLNEKLRRAYRMF